MNQEIFREFVAITEHIIRGIK